MAQLIEIVILVMLVASVVLSVQGGRDLREAGVPELSGWDTLGYTVFLGSLLLIAGVLFSLVIR